MTTTNPTRDLSHDTLYKQMHKCNFVWKMYAMGSISFHYLFFLIGAVASVCPTLFPDNTVMRTVPLISVVTMVVLSEVQLKKIYRKFIQASRSLSGALLQYQENLIDNTALIKVYSDLETEIDKGESGQY